MSKQNLGIQSAMQMVIYACGHGGAVVMSNMTPSRLEVQVVRENSRKIGCPCCEMNKNEVLARGLLAKVGVELPEYAGQLEYVNAATQMRTVAIFRLFDEYGASNVDQLKEAMQVPMFKQRLSLLLNKPMRAWLDPYAPVNVIQFNPDYQPTINDEAKQVGMNAGRYLLGKLRGAFRGVYQ